MFTWICPQCGREVPPSYTDCPDCAGKTAGAGKPATAGPPAGPPAYPPPPPQAAPLPPAAAPPAQGAPPAPQPPYAPQTGQYYAPQPYPPQQYQQPYPPQGYPPQAYPPQQYPTQQYPTQQYPPQPYQGSPYPPQQYPPQYGPPQYTAPYPPPPQQSYAPPAPAHTEAAPPFSAPPPEPPVYVEPPPQRSGGTLFGSAPAEPPAYAPPPPPAPPFVEPAPVPVSAPPEPSHEPGAPRAGGMLFGPATPEEAAPRKGPALPTWLMAVLFAVGGIAVIWGIYSLVGSHPPKPSTTVESAAAKPGAPTNVWQKYIEVSGVRFVENAKKEPVVKFVLINHSGEDAEGLAGNVTLWARTQKSEEEAAGTFTFNTNVPANGTKDLEAPLTTKLKIYELPDWQYLSTDLQITAPGPASAGGGAAK